MSDTPAPEESPLPLHRIIEAILFTSQKPVSAKELANFLKGAAESAKDNPLVSCHAKIKQDTIRAAIETLETEYAESGRSFEVRESAAGWQLVTRADFAPWLRQLFPENRQARLSAPAMETLAIIAYRQPITRADIEAVRGVAVDGVMQTLLDRGLARIAGRADIPGRPLLYETTQFFMEHFGLKNLDDLPNASELRRVPLPSATQPAEAPPEAPAEKPASPEPPAEPTTEQISDNAPSPEPPAEASHTPASTDDQSAEAEADHDVPTTPEATP